MLFGGSVLLLLSFLCLCLWFGKGVTAVRTDTERVVA